MLKNKHIEFGTRFDKRLARIVSLILTACLAFTALPSQAETAAQTWIGNSAKGIGSAGVFHDSFAGVQEPWVFAQKYPDEILEGVTYKPIATYSCSALQGDCSVENIRSLKNGASVSSPMPVCTEKTKTFCVESIELGKVGSNSWENLIPENLGSYNGSIQSNILGTPEGGMNSKWTSKDGKVFTYLSRADWGLQDGRMVPGNFTANIYPTKVSSGTVKLDSNTNALWSVSGETGVWVPGSVDDTFKVTIHVPTSWGRFASGRMSLESFTSQNLGDSAIKLQIVGSSATVPYVQAQLDQSFWLTQTPFKSIGRAPLGLRIGTEQTGEIKSDIWKEIIRVTGDKSTGTQQLWQLSILSHEVLYKYVPVNTVPEACINPLSPFVGIVASDAMAVGPKPPTYENGTFEYQVSGTHFSQDGNLTSGNVTYLLDTRILKCVYKVANSPVNATVTVVNSTGENTVTTTVVKNVGLATKLEARNIHFSSPRIQVKFLPPKKTTLVCVKGKITKKITGVEPKCPTGYKKR